MSYLLDTNIVLIYTRRGEMAELLESEYNLLSGDKDLYISVVTVAELKSIVLQRNYGEKKVQALEDLLLRFGVIDINLEEILDRYAEIDAYSQGKLKARKSSFSARNMGKNDLFIAASSSVYDLILITTDKDFDHLKPEFIKLEYVDVKKYKK